MIYSQYLEGYEKILQQKYRITSTIRHKGEKGRQREHGLKMFLSENLPGAYGVATGEIIPYGTPEPSPQCDIIIYDRLRMPVIGLNDAVQQVPLEAVYAVIECKSLLDSSALRDADQKFRAIRRMPKSPAQLAAPIREVRSPFLIVFGYELKTKSDTCLQFMNPFVDLCDVNVVALNKGLGVWLTNNSKSRAIWLNTSDETLHQTLALFFLSFLDDLNSLVLPTPRFCDWLRVPETP
jgi:hypothetical protein